MNNVMLASGGVALSTQVGAADTRTDDASVVTIDPKPRFDLSPYLYMQFMEPLGATDGSVAAAWDYRRNQWRQDLVEVARGVAPPLLRWGGCFSSYYRWKEAVGPVAGRIPMHNILWGGMEDNRVGTVEFVDFCRRVGAEPLICVNFDSDGRRQWMRDPDGGARNGGPDEAAEWVAYCNEPHNAARLAHGIDRFTESLGHDRLKPNERDGLFIVGIFSLLDVMLDTSFSSFATLSVSIFNSSTSAPYGISKQNVQLIDSYFCNQAHR